MKPTLRSALGFAVACFVGVATSGCRVVRRTLRQTALLAVLCAAPIWAKAVYQNGTAALNVNFATPSTIEGGSRLAENTYYGVVPFLRNKWHEMAGAQSNDNRVLVTASSLTDSAGHGSATVTINARVFEAQNPNTGAILLRDAAIDDYETKEESTLTITGIPYACYDVYLYMAGTERAYNSPVRIKAENKTYSDYYYMPANKEAALTSTSAQTWGSAQAWATTKLGVNVMRIADLTSPSITFATQQLSDARANFAAIQIVERVAVTTYEATLAENASVAATELDVTLSSDGTTTKKLSEVTAEESVSITLAGDATISGAVTAKHLQVTGTGTLTCSGAVTVAGEIRAETGANLVLASATTSAATTISGGGTVNLTPTSLGGAVTATTDLILTAPESATEDNLHTISQALTIGVNDGRQLGSLTTRGFLKFTDTGSNFYSPLIVESDTLEATCAGQGIKGGLVIKKEGTFKGTRTNSDKLNYSAAVTVDVYGTLDMNGTRWTLGANNVINVYPGAEVKGLGEVNNQGTFLYGAFDANADGLSMNFKRATNAADEKGGDITFSSSFRVRGATRVYTLNVAEGVTVNFSGTRSPSTDSNADAGLVAKTGLGKLVLQGDFILAGASSGPIEVQATKTLTLGSGASAVVHTASITGAGSVVLTGATTTLTLPEKTSTPIEVQSNATLKIPVTEAELESGYTASTVTVSGGTVKFVTPSGQEIAATGVDNNVLSSEIAWTGNGDGASWSDKANWEGNTVPSAYVAIPLTKDLALTLPAGGATVARLRVWGTDAAHTLTLSSGALSVWGGLSLSKASLTATTATLPLTDVTAINLGEGSTLNYTVAEAESVSPVPVLTGSGTFIKHGEGTLKFSTAKEKACFADGVTVDVQAGKLAFIEKAYTPPVLRNATLRFAEGAKWGSDGWPEINETVTIEVVGSTNTLKLTTGSDWGVSLAGKGKLVKAGEGTLQLPVKPSNGWSGAGEIRAGTLELLAANNGKGTNASQTGTIGGNLSGSGKLKIGSGTVTLTGDNTNYTGDTTVADGAKVKVDAPGKFGTGEVNIAAGGTVEFYQPGNDAVDHRTESYSQVKGEGTVCFTGSSWRTLPSNAANIWANTLAVENNVEGGLVLVDKSKVYKIGTLSGSGCFWADGDTSGVATLEVIQRADATFSGCFRQEGENSSILALKVLGESMGTLTLSGTTENTSPATLTVEERASVVLTKAWAGPVTVNGKLAIGTAEAPAKVTLPQAVTEGETGEIVLPVGANLTSNLTLSADSVFSGALTGTGTVTVASAKTLTLKPSEPKLFEGVIAGAGSLVVGDGKTASTVKLTGANTYTGTTTVAKGATLALAREREREEEWVLSDAFGDGSAVIVVKDGTLELAKGSYCRRTKGEGTIRVLNDQTFAIGQAALPDGVAWSPEMTTGLTGFTGTLALVGNLKLTNAASASGYAYAPTGFSVRFEGDGKSSSDGELQCDETGKTSFTLAAGRTLSGEGIIKCPITFEANSVIEVTKATRLNLSKATITLPSGEGKHILLKADVASNGFLYFDRAFAMATSAFDFAADSTLTASKAGVNIFRSSEAWGLPYDTLQVLANPSVPEGTTDGVAEAVRDQTNFGGSPVTVTSVTADAEKPKVKLEGALFFENVVKTEMKRAETGVFYTAKVTYDFGVSAITVKKLTLADEPELCVVVCAKVESAAIDGTPAVFKKSAKVQLYLNGALCNAATALTGEGDQSERWFAVPLGSLPTTGTSNFTVKVTEATP